MNRTGWLWICALLLLLGGPLQAWQEPVAPATEEEPQEEAEESAPQTVDERIEELDQKIRVLERRDELEKEQAAEKAKTATNVTSGRDGFSFRSTDGAYQLRLRGYVQFDGRFFQEDDERPATDTFLLRRVRPIFEGTVFKIFDFRVMPDFGGGTTVLQDAYLDARFSPKLKVRAGKFKPPVGLERLQSGQDLLFVERAFPTNLVPNRDLGIQLHGDLARGNVNWAVGVFNGVPDGSSGDVDANDGKDIAARLFFQPFLAGAGPWKGLGFGVSASTGDQEGTLTSTGLAGYRTPAQQTFFSYRSDATAAGTVIADGDRFRLSPQGYLYRGRFGLLTEYVISRQEVRRSDVAEELENTSWQVATSWVLSGGEPTFRGVAPKANFDPAAGTWGAFELAARYSVLEVDEDTFPLFANLASSAESAESWALGLNWYLNRNLRLYLDYERTQFDGGAATGDREDENILFSRFQIAF
ncbi:MAG TPA: porin [Thermoanaerobaculia bacterium]|nr:porin [Thermoanaerobaculia bacterium]